MVTAIRTFNLLHLSLLMSTLRTTSSSSTEAARYLRRHSQHQIRELASDNDCVTIRGYDNANQIVEVSIQQCVFPNDCDVVDRLMAVYEDATAGKQICGLDWRKANACDEQTSIQSLKCDPSTKKAIIQLYANDKDLLKKGDKVPNSDLLECGGKGRSMSYTVQREVVVDCNVGAEENSAVNTCSETHDDCDSTVEYCNHRYVDPDWEVDGDEYFVYECKAYVAPQSTCGGFMPEGHDSRCNPSESFCYYWDECWSGLADGPGVCEPYASTGTCIHKTRIVLDMIHLSKFGVTHPKANVVFHFKIKHVVIPTYQQETNVQQEPLANRKHFGLEIVLFALECCQISKAMIVHAALHTKIAQSFLFPN